MASAVILRHVTLDDAQFLYDLLACRPPEANISHRQMPTFEQHLAFIAGCPYEAWYLIIRHSLAGTIYLTRQGEIGIHVLPAHARHGVASLAIRQLMRLHPRKRFLANVAPHNAASSALFTKLGFVAIQTTYEYCP